jgi:hypothetical protein
LAAPNVKNKFAQANSNGTTAATIFTHGTGLKDPDGSASGNGGILNRLVIYNADTVAHDIQIYRIPSGGSAGATNLIERITLPALGIYALEGPFYSLDSGFYQVKLGEAHTTTAVSCQAYYNELT